MGLMLMEFDAGAVYIDRKKIADIRDVKLEFKPYRGLGWTCKTCGAFGMVSLLEPEEAIAAIRARHASLKPDCPVSLDLTPQPDAPTPA